MLAQRQLNVEQGLEAVPHDEGGEEACANAEAFTASTSSSSSLDSLLEEKEGEPSALTELLPVRDRPTLEPLPSSAEAPAAPLGP